MPAPNEPLTHDCKYKMTKKMFNNIKKLCFMMFLKLVKTL